MPEWPPMFVDESHVDAGHVSLEREVMDLLLAGDDPVLSGLREQLQQCRVAKRMFSGVGFVTDFALPTEVSPIDAKSLFFLSDVRADLNGQRAAAGFHCQVKGGRLKLLEGFSFNDQWPSTLMDFKAYYHYPASVAAKAPDQLGGTRNLDYVRSQWTKG